MFQNGQISGFLEARNNLSVSARSAQTTALLAKLKFEGHLKTAVLRSDVNSKALEAVQ